MSGKVDLHIHTTASDGTVSPEAAVELAYVQGLKAIAITDHDTVSGCTAAMERGKELGVEVMQGLEISTKFKAAVHILGYGMELDSPVLTKTMDWEVHDRDARNEKICALMAADGIPIRYEQMRARFGTVIGRPHFARILAEQGIAEDMADAFRRYVNRGGIYYVPRNMLTIEQAIEVITGSGGIAVLAHPFQYKLEEVELRELIERCTAAGLRGMECRYTGYDERQCACLEALAQEYGLIRTGGSDFHGANKPQIEMGSDHGELNVPYEWYEILKDELKKES